MGDCRISEAVLRTNAEIVLFEAGGKQVATKALGANAAETWIRDFVDRIELADAEVARLSKWADEANDAVMRADKDDRSKAVAEHLELTQALSRSKAERFRAVQDALRAYNPLVFTDAVINEANPAQLIHAFKELLTVTDPTRAGHLLELDRLRAVADAARPATR